jgi:hypothetical protein
MLKGTILFALLLIGAALSARTIDPAALKAIADDDPKEVAYFWHMYVEPLLQLNLFDSTDPHIDFTYLVSTHAL